MCPACFANIALLLTGVVSTGGVTAAAVKVFRNRKAASNISEVRNTRIRNFKEKSE
jgi:hypothetical protein